VSPHHDRRHFPRQTLKKALDSGAPPAFCTGRDRMKQRRARTCGHIWPCNRSACTNAGGAPLSRLFQPSGAGNCLPVVMGDTFTHPRFAPSNDSVHLHGRTQVLSRKLRGNPEMTVSDRERLRQSSYRGGVQQRRRGTVPARIVQLLELRDRIQPRTDTRYALSVRTTAKWKLRDGAGRFALRTCILYAQSASTN